MITTQKIASQKKNEQKGKKWTAQFMQKYKAEKEANTAKNQERTTRNDEIEKDTTETQEEEERNEADIREDDTQRRKQANKALWEKRIPTTITIGTEYRRIDKKKEMQMIKGEKQEDEDEYKIVQNALEFADDTQLFIEHDTEEQMNERIGNYDIVTETRRLTIQWSKVELLRKGTNKQKFDLPPPFNEIKHKNAGTILGKEINMNGSLKQAVKKE